MAKKEYDRYEVEIRTDKETVTETLHLREAAEAVYERFKRKDDCIVALYGIDDWAHIKKIRCNYFTKTLYIFYGSLSVLEVLEAEGIDRKVQYGMTQQEAFDVAQGVIEAYFKRTGSSWEYDLDLDVEVFRGKDLNKLIMDAEHSIDNFEHTHDDFEEYDGSGNAQGFTAFTI